MGHIMDMVPMPFARRRAPENVLMQSVPAASCSFATRPDPADEIMMGRRLSTLFLRFARMVSVEIRLVIIACLVNCWECSD